MREIEAPRTRVLYGTYCNGNGDQLHKGTSCHYTVPEIQGNSTYSVHYCCGILSVESGEVVMMILHV